MARRSDTKGAISASGVSTALLFVAALAMAWAWHSPFLFPLKILVVLMHESGHALGALLTGGRLLTISVGMDEGGQALTAGGSAFVTLNCGYLGSLAWGMLLLTLTRGTRGGQGVSALLSVGLFVLTLGWIRPAFSFGFVYSMLAAVGFGVLARFSPGVNRIVLRSLGLFSVLYALADIVDDVLSRPGAPSDAAALSVLTGVPTLAWGVGWIVVSGLVLALFRKRLV